eukprot:TRINITY_DN5374_c0_g1_i2.p1 TRINITY_DN5374_c0_g1~~TRINITY_DN5374_c0_g1_i2.p1  ORF type:complete len:228 (-),score=23.58 TRINITY_DN5374_c0_g1_i2:29-649(-)
MAVASFDRAILIHPTLTSLSIKSSRTTLGKFPSKLVSCRHYPNAIKKRLLPVSAMRGMEFLGAKSMATMFEVELRVRDYELDQYGVVNNAVYASYCQYSRYELLEEIGISPTAIAHNGDALALSEISLKFLAPLRRGDRFVVTSRISGISVARIYIDHFIYKLPDKKPVLEGKATCVYLDKSYRPTRLPPDFRAKITMFLRKDELA